MSSSNQTILIVEDDYTIATLMREHLLRWGFSVIIAEDFSDILGLFRQVRPDLILLDISLPYYNGYYWCIEIRKESQVPILFLSSHTENTDVIMAVNMGGDEYITKPVSMDVLIAKINALMRRAYGYTVEARTLSARGATFNPSDGTLCYDAQTLELTRNESRILRLLLEHKNTIVSRDALMKALWDDEHFIDENTLSVNVNRLRKKLEGIALTDFIQTKKSEGYIIHDPDVSAP